MALGNSGRISESLICFQEAIKIDPRNPIGWNNKGVILREQGKYQDAINAFDEAINIDPSYELAKKNREMAQEDLSLGLETDTTITSSAIL